MKLSPRGLVVAVLLGTGATFAADKPQTPSVVFEKDVVPIFKARCLRCHGADSVKAGLDLRSKAMLLTGGESGPAVSPGSAEKSLLWIKIAADKMPPGKEKLTEAQKVTLRSWIESGARDDGTAAVKPEPTKDQVTDADRDFWAFRAPRRAAVPVVQQTDRVRNAIDRFLLAALEKKGLTYAPDADRLTLIRRAYFDLIGLPPSPNDVAAFLADPAADAYEKLIDRLLASPQYGERWGRHWLDLAGYADSEGILDADYVRTAAWRYRDYVIRAFNADKAYDRFLKEQIAGDELVDYWTAHRTQKEMSPDVVEGLTATGYLRCASDTSRPDFVTIKNAPGYYFQTLDDTVKIVASSTMGLTVQCARCHSHKYDPIPQTDYYRVQAVFMSAYRPYEWVPQVQRRLLEATAAQEKEVNEHNAKVDAAIARLTKEGENQKRTFAERLFSDRLAALPAPIRDDVRIALATEVAKRNEVQKYLVGKFQKELRPEGPALVQAVAAYPEHQAQTTARAAAIKAEQAKKRVLPEIRALYDLPGEARTHLLRRGDYLNPGPEVQPGVLSVLGAPRPFAWSPPGKESRTSGRRTAFAEWLTQPNHPLTARVLVNRVWLQHFGEGIVATADNFGRAGAAPIHPELLDWLATEFVARDWSIKALHRLVMTSSSYRQASGFDTASQGRARTLDPDNRLLWRQRLRRLEAEPLRDAVLYVSSVLNSEMYGSPVPMVRQGDGEVVTPAGAAGQRRSIYLQVRRSQPLTLLQVFDQPVMETNCTRRGSSTVSSQARTLLNGDVLSRLAESFAARVLKEDGADPAGYAMQVAFGRPARDKERATLLAFLDAQTARHCKVMSGEATKVTPAQQQMARQRAMADLCQMLLNANEFVYVD